MTQEELATRIRCLAIVGAATKEKLLKQSTILAIPSYFENMPNVLLEGMAAGLGIVASCVGAMPDMLGAEGALLIQPGDRAGLAKALEDLLSSPTLVMKQGKRNREVVAREYSMEIVERHLERLYQELVPGKGSLPEDLREGTNPSNSSLRQDGRDRIAQP